MAGRMISELSDATTLQNTDLIPLARGSQTLKLSGGLLSPKGGGTDKIFFENDQTVTANYTVTNGKNAMSAGPITVAAGVNVTVPSGSVWMVV